MTRILLIEDNYFTAEVTQAMLKLHNFDVVWAKDGLAGLQAWGELKPHAIVTDLFMPGIDGIELIEIVRKTDTIVPIVAVSATSEHSPRNLQMARLKGADLVLEKPVRAGQVVSALRELVAERAARAALAA